MSLSEDRFITDELLSAYLDDAVTPQERQRIETAVAQDSDVAWRLESLRQTVSLLQALPEVPLPRSFVLRPDQVQDTVAAGGTALPAGQRVTARPPVQPGLWKQFLAGWQAFWYAGNPTLRNAAAVSLAAFLVLLVGGAVTNVGRLAPAGTMATAPMSAPAAEPEVVALVVPADAQRSAPAVQPENVQAQPGHAAYLAPDEEAPPATEETAEEAPMTMQALSETGAPPVVAPMPAPDVPGLLMAPGGMGVGGGNEMGSGAMGMGGDRQGGAGAAAESGLLPPEAYMTSPDQAIIIEPAPMVAAAPAAESSSAAPVESARMADVVPEADAMTEAAAQDELPAAESAVTATEAEDATLKTGDQTAPTPEAVALARPAATQAPDAAYPAAELAPIGTSAPGLPLLAIAQAGGALLTVLFASLWWRSRAQRKTSR
jgi:hypothetical protein